LPIAYLFQPINSVGKIGNNEANIGSSLAIEFIGAPGGI